MKFPLHRMVFRSLLFRIKPRRGDLLIEISYKPRTAPEERPVRFG
ncbi:hypothetical protein BH24BAC1_BH24BAC1_19560 [soil metagenome]